MLAIFCMQIMHLSIATGLCVDIFLHGPTYDRANAVYGGDDDNDNSSNGDGDDSGYNNVAIIVIALLLFGLIFDVVSLILLSQLIHFHIGLQRDKISTYQYIVRDHQRRRETTRLEKELQSQRIIKIQKYRTESNHCAARKLQVGHACRNIGCTMLDPMKLPRPAPAAATTTTKSNGGVDGAAANGSEVAAASTIPKSDLEAGFAASLGNLPSPLADLNNEDNDDIDHDDNQGNHGNGNSRGGIATNGNNNEEEEECARPAALSSSMISSQPSTESQFSTSSIANGSASASTSSSSSSMQNRIPSLHHATLLAPDDEDDLDNNEDEYDNIKQRTTSSSSGGGISFIKVNPTNSSSPSLSSSSPANGGGVSSSSLATGEQLQHLQEQKQTVRTKRAPSDAPPSSSPNTGSTSRSNVAALRKNYSPPR
jgi:hypothetical protein